MNTILKYLEQTKKDDVLYTLIANYNEVFKYLCSDSAVINFLSIS